jgi:sortase A
VKRRLRSITGIACFLLGATLLLWAGAIAVRATAWQARHTATFQEGAHEGGPAPAVEPASAGGPGVVAESELPVAEPRRGSAVARLLIKRLGVDVVVVEGTDAASLRLGPGHLEGSALPGDPDNCIIAGHRDGPFGLLSGTRPGDQVEIRSRSGTELYRVDSIQVVDKDDSGPLAVAREPILTLITCYPINHLGPAPRRLIVRAALVEKGIAAKL